MAEMSELTALAEASGVTADEWDELALRSGDILQSREWLTLWWEQHQTGLDLVPLVARDVQGRLAGLMPLVKVRTRPALLRPVGPWPPAEPALLTDGTAVAVSALADQLDQRSDWSVLQTIGFPTGLGFDPGARGYFVYGEEPNRVIDFDGADWEGHLSRQSKNFRKKLRQNEEALHREFTVRFHRADDLDRLGMDIGEVVRLHRLRWPESAVLTPASEKFHRDFIRLAFDRGWLQLWFVELDGRNAACALAFRYGGVETFYMSGRDPSYDRVRAGQMLGAHLIRESADAGMTELRFLRGRQEDKRRLANVDRPVANRIYARGAAGLATTLALTGRRTLRTRGRSAEPAAESSTD